MAKANIPYEDFIAMVDPQMVPFVNEVNGYLLQNGCTLGIEPAKSGYVVSYKHKASERTMVNFVFRKKGLVIRIYADNVRKYMEYLEQLPKAMLQSIAKAPVGRPMINPELCNAHCPKGYEFLLGGEIQQKCRYNCFLLFLSEEANPYIMEILRKEMAQRPA